MRDCIQTLLGTFQTTHTGNAPCDGLWYLFGKRYYDPEIGLWTSTDPIEQYWSPYTYCGNNPMLIVDPDGMGGIPIPSIDQFLKMGGVDLKQINDASQQVIDASNSAIDASNRVGIAVSGVGIVVPPVRIAGELLQAPATIRDVKALATGNADALTGVSLWTEVLSKGLGTIPGKVAGTFAQAWGFVTDALFEVSKAQLENKPVQKELP